MVDTARDHHLVPSGTILVFESKDVAFGICPRRESGGIEQHEREQGMRARLISRRMLREQRSQSNRFLAKILFDQVIAARRFVALVEKQIESLQNGIETVREFFTCGNFKWNALIPDLLLGSRQALCNRRLRREKGA